MFDVGVLGAFLGGLLSFLSPCVLPLVPPYLCYVAGLSAEEFARPSDRSSAHVLRAALAFVLGFSTVFVALGATASLIGQTLARHIDTLTIIGGVAIILMGLHFLGVFRIGLLYREGRVSVNRSVDIWGAYVMGLAFAFGWTPCIGPILGGILGLAASRESVAEGMQMLAVYSLGLGVPFLLTSVAINRFFTAAARIRKHYRTIELVSGGLLLGIGILIFFDQFSLIAQYLTPYLPTF